MLLLWRQSRCGGCLCDTIMWIYCSQKNALRLSYGQVAYSRNAQLRTKTVLLALLDISPAMDWEVVTTALHSGEDRIKLPTFIYLCIVGIVCLAQWGIAITDRLSTGIKQLLSVPTMIACLLLPVMVAGQNTGRQPHHCLNHHINCRLYIKHLILFWRSRRLIRCCGALNLSMLHQCCMASQHVSMRRSSVFRCGQVCATRHPTTKQPMPATQHPGFLDIIYWCQSWEQ